MRIPLEKERTMKLTEKEFLANVLSDKDPKNQGRYKVHIPDLMHHLSETEGIFVKNHIHKNRITPSDNGNYGQYYPLQPGTIVMVKFFENDYNTGYIDRIVSDYEIDSLPLKIRDRDDFHQIFRTPKFDNLLVINENTTDQPPNSIHLYFNKYRTTIIIDEEGIHIYSDDNKDEEIKKDVDQLHHQNHKLHVKGNYDLYVDGEIKIYASGTINLQSGSGIHMDAPVIHMNSGTSQKAEPAVIPEARFNDKSKSDPSSTKRVIKEDGKFADYDYFKRKK